MKMRLFLSTFSFGKISQSVISATFGFYVCLFEINFNGDGYESIYEQGGCDYGSR